MKMSLCHLLHVKCTIFAALPGEGGGSGAGGSRREAAAGGDPHGPGGGAAQRPPPPGSGELPDSAAAGPTQGTQYTQLELDADGCQSLMIKSHLPCDLQ